MRGGKRPGAGRPKGAKTKASVEMIADAKAAGELPHEFLLRVARGEPIGDHLPTFDQRVKAAIAGARFYAPQLSSIEAKVDTTVSHEQALDDLDGDE